MRARILPIFTCGAFLGICLANCTLPAKYTVGSVNSYQDISYWNFQGLEDNFRRLENKLSWLEHTVSMMGYDVSDLQRDGEQLDYTVEGLQDALLSVAESVSDNTSRMNESEFAIYNLDTRVEAVEDAIGLLPPNPALDALMRLDKKQRETSGSDQ